MSSLTFDALQIANSLRQDEGDPQHQLTEDFFALELAGEVGELANKIKKRWRRNLLGIHHIFNMRDGKPRPVPTIEEIAEEIADVVIVCGILANCYGINLGQAVRDTFNGKSQAGGSKVFIEEKSPSQENDTDPVIDALKASNIFRGGPISSLDE